MISEVKTPPAAAHILDALNQLQRRFDGELRIDDTSRTIYSTDASVYQETPLAVAMPKTERDVENLVRFARKVGTSLIPRTAGTSLSGQCVGSGIVVDVSRHFTKILEVNKEEGWVRVQPGVVRNELNLHLAPFGLLFGPETSTQNRAMIGGMVGNNSCGSNSIVYGSTRDHVLELRGFLSDGSEATFRAISPDEFDAKCSDRNTTLEGAIYRGTRALLSDPAIRDEIAREFPKPEIPRRNTGYAIDLLMDAQPLAPEGRSNKPFNFCKLLAGSEGTLFFTTELKLSCSPLPPAASGVVCAHFATVDEALRATVMAVQYKPFGCELIDDFVLRGAARNLEQRANMQTFVAGTPNAILIIHFRAETNDEIRALAAKLETELRAAKLGYHFPLLIGEDEEKVWNLRKAGLGILSTTPGDEKSTAVIEDTAVAVSDLPAYIAEFDANLKRDHGLECVHYAHAGTGEIHLRPILNLKTQAGIEQFRAVASDVADLVKKYRGSLSGEHGDGRLRGEFLSRMIGDKNYEVVKQIKQLWDPHGVFNPHKIVDTPPMNTGLRFTPDQPTPEYHTIFDFSATQGVLRAAEMCSGSGDCRKTELTGGTMCPSYMATRDERDTTRARANMLRNILTHPTDQDRPFDNEEVKDILDLCMSCKGCKRECPSNVDMAKLKAEFMQGYYDVHGVPRRARLIADFAKHSAMAAKAPWLYNFAVSFPPVAHLLKRFAGFAQQRSLPRMHSVTLRKWFETHEPHANAGQHGKVFLFCDEFTNYNDTPIGIAAVELLERLGFEVGMPYHLESGRAALSKGLVRQARDLAEQNVRLLKHLITDKTPLLGIEPSAILSFRDEYPELVGSEIIEQTKLLSQNCLMIDEFLDQHRDTDVLREDLFTDETKEIRLHGHCHQKALSRLLPTVRLLNLPKNYTVKPMVDGEGFYKTGCCGMAGSFGYEQEHFEISKQIGELVLIPAVKQLSEDVIVAAPGTSCRHQIADFANRRALHPVEILRAAFV